MSNINSIEWRRVYTEDSSVVDVLAGGVVENSDVDQGALGCCYALAGYCTCADRSYRMQEHILTDHLNDAGLFAM